MTSKRHNGEGSIYPYKNGFAAYVWVNKPDGTRGRKYVYGQEREEVHAKWLKLHQQAKEGPVATKGTTVAKFVAYWLDEIVEPNLTPGTHATYESACRLYIVPGLGRVRLDKLKSTDVQTWLNSVGRTCQCCAQGKDARRSMEKRRCCAIKKCCGSKASQVQVVQLRRILRAILTCAIEAELITKNVAKQTRLPTVRKKRRTAWTSDEARRFLERTKVHDQRFYAAYVIVLVLGLRKGEVLGLAWDQIDWDGWDKPCGAHDQVFCEDCREKKVITLRPDFQVQRVGRRLLRREVKSESSESALPLPGIVVGALLRHRQALVDKGVSVELGELLFTTASGAAIEPRNFNRFWDRQLAAAGVPDITVHDARRTCATLLRDLDVHPRVAQRILRHAQVAITLDIYTEVTDDATIEALRKLGGSLE